MNLLKEKLIIKNFGPIKSVELELGRFNILIGDQGTGKSTVAKVLLAIRKSCFVDIFNNSEPRFNNFKNFKTNLEQIGLENFTLTNETFFYYRCKEFIFEWQSLDAISIVSQRNNFSQSNYLGFDSIYIPAERNLVTTLSNSLFDIMKLKVNLPNLFLDFGSKFDKARIRNYIKNYQDVVGVTYNYQNFQDWVIKDNGNRFLMKDASTGLQGSVALMMVFNHSNENQSQNLIIIEEPELNLFPLTQNKLIKRIVYDLMEGNNSTLITTHSPYTLTSLNNMMYAYELGQEHGEEVEKVMDKKYWLNPQEVSAYMMKEDGTCEDILDYDESGTLIKADKIDGVSRELNEVFDALIAIEHA